MNPSCGYGAKSFIFLKLLKFKKFVFFLIPVYVFEIKNIGIHTE